VPHDPRDRRRERRIRSPHSREGRVHLESRDGCPRFSSRHPDQLDRSADGLTMRIAPVLLLLALASLPAELRAGPTGSVTGRVEVMSGRTQVQGQYVYVYLESMKKR